MYCFISLWCIGYAKINSGIKDSPYLAAGASRKDTYICHTYAMVVLLLALHCNALVSGEDEKYYVYAGLQVHNFNTVQAVAEMAL